MEASEFNGRLSISLGLVETDLCLTPGKVEMRTRSDIFTLTITVPTMLAVEKKRSLIVCSYSVLGEIFPVVFLRS